MFQINEKSLESCSSIKINISMFFAYYNCTSLMHACSHMHEFTVKTLCHMCPSTVNPISAAGDGALHILTA